jgi:hypothetical protein
MAAELSVGPVAAAIYLGWKQFGILVYTINQPGTVDLVELASFRSTGKIHMAIRG